MSELDKISVEVEDTAILIDTLKKANTYLESAYVVGCLSPMVTREMLITARNIVNKCEMSLYINSKDKEPNPL